MCFNKVRRNAKDTCIGCSVGKKAHNWPSTVLETVESAQVLSMVLEGIQQVLESTILSCQTLTVNDNN